MKSQLVLSSIVILLALAGLFIFLTIKNSKSCYQLVIDTYEIHSGINIPEVIPVNCYYDEDDQVRLSVYIVLGELQLEKFATLDSNAALKLLKGRYLLDETELPHSNKLQIGTGSKWSRAWTYIYDAETKRLYAELVY